MTKSTLSSVLLRRASGVPSDGHRALPRPRVAPIVAVIALLVPALLPSDQWIRVAAVALIYIGLASGLNILVGFTGLLDLGYIAFFIVGAYTTAILTVRILGLDGRDDTAAAQWATLATIPIAIVVAMVFGVVLGYPTLRARGDYLAIMTLAFGEIIRLLVLNMTEVTGGAVGIRGIAPLGVAGTKFLSPTSIYYSVLAVVATLVLILVAIIASPVGRAWVAIREDELVASSMGIRTRRYKLLAYVTGAGMASVIGVLFAHMQQFINPDSFTLEDNFIVLSLVILGGSGTIWGPVVGASAWIFFSNWARGQELVQQHPELQTGALALIVLIVMILRPQGLVTARPMLGSTRSSEFRVARAVPQLPHRGPGNTTDLVLEATHLSRSFGGLKALDDVSISVRREQIVGLMGPNGAGKSTLLNVLSGVTRADVGTLVLGGQVVDRAEPHVLTALGAARTFQNIRLFGDMTVLENLLVGAHDRVRTGLPQLVARSKRFRERERRAAEEAIDVLEFVGLIQERNAVAGTLSYGHQRRLEIARALMTAPTLLMLDEPAAGMNETESRDLAKLILKVRSAGLSVIVIEHDMDLLMSISDRVFVMDHGAVIARGTPAEVRADPVVLEAYLGTVQ